MKPHQLRPATTGHSSLLTSATSWMDARRPRIRRRRVERGIVLQVLALAMNGQKCKSKLYSLLCHVSSVGLS